MLGFGKKNKKQKEPEKNQTLLEPARKPEAPKADTHADPPASGENAGPPPRKKTKKLFQKLSPKRLMVFLVLPALVAAAAWVGYAWFFTDRGEKTPAYTNIQMPHASLPEEMRRFCFNQMPELYEALVAYNNTITLFDHEIARITEIGEQYPEQKKIADAEKKVWERSKQTLVKAFSRIEDTVKQMYVLFQVNEEEGLAMIQERKDDLVTAAQDALAPAMDQAGKITHQPSREPEGFLQGLFYNLKKKFL